MSTIIGSHKIGFSFNDLPIGCKLLLTLSFIEAIGGGISYHIAYFFSVSSSFNKLDIGFLGFAMGVGGIFGSLYGGYYSGKVQVKKLIGASFLLTGLAFISLTKLNFFYVTGFFVVIMGFGINLFITCSNSTLLHLSNEINYSLTITQSYKNALENAGCIIAMILIMLLAQNYFKSVMFSIGFLLISVAIYVLIKLDIKNEEIKSTFRNEKKIKTVYAALLPMLFSVFCIGLTYGIQKTVLGIHLNETIGNSLIVGLFFAADPILITLFQVKLSKFVEQYNKHLIASLGCLLLGVSTFAMGLSSTGYKIFASLVLFTLGEMLFMSHSVALCHQYGSSNHRGLGIGSWRSAYALGMMLGPLISGVAMYYSDAKSAWTISSCLCLFSASLVLPSKKYS